MTGWLLALVLIAGSAAKPDDAPKPIRTYEGHTKAVLSIAFSSDGKTLAAGSLDHLAITWNAASGDQIASFDPKYAITGIGFSPDGKLLGTASWGGQIWELDGGLQRNQLEANTGFCTCAAFPPGGKTFLTGALDGTAKLWDIVTAQMVREFNHKEALNSLAISKDGKYLATAGDGYIKIWDFAIAKELRTITQRETTSIAFAPDGSMVAGACGDSIARLWVVNGDKPARQFKGHTDRVLSIAFSPDGSLIATGAADKSIRFWKLPSGDLSLAISALPDAVNCLAFAPDGKTLACGCADKCVLLWKAPESNHKPVTN